VEGNGRLAVEPEKTSAGNAAAQTELYPNEDEPMPEQLPIALQMYTVREETVRDFAHTVADVAKIGYAGVELAGFGSAGTASVAKQCLDEAGLIVVGVHFGLDDLEHDINKVIEDSQTLGNEYVIVPAIGGYRRASLAAYRQVAHVFNDLGARLRDAGLVLAYHNHDFEFEKFGGATYGYDALFEVADPELVKIEMDTFWVKRAGEDPAAYMRKYAGRVPLVHLKDMTPEGGFAEVGEGTMDFQAIFDAAKIAGTQFYIVEQDRCDNHAPLESVRISFENLKKMGMVS
jgi:sugar phosphate isomerase/epimerase